MAPSVIAAGVDTWSPAWRVDATSLAGGMLSELACQPGPRGALMPDKIGGHRVGWIPASGMLYAEGHPFGSESLVSPALLGEAYSELVDELLGAGVPLPPGNVVDDIYGGRADGFAGVRRIDGTVTIATESAPEGLAIAAGVAALARDAPGGKAEVFFGPDGAVETVYFRGRGGKKVLGRWYDEGIAHGSGPRGRLIRAEDQRRFVKASRRDVPELTPAYVRAKFQQRFYTLYQATRGVTVAGPMVLRDKLREAIDAGEITPTQAERIAGHLLMSTGAGTGGREVSKATRNRRKAVTRELGLVLADGVLQEVEVDLHDVLTQAMDCDAWGQG